MKNMKLSILVLAFFAFAMTVTAAPLTAVSGIITWQNSSVVDGATVMVVCEHSGVNYTQIVSSGTDGKYYAFYPGMSCASGDTAWVHASKGSANGMNDGTVLYNNMCKINTALIDVTIPEFGVIAGGIALVGAIAGFLILRRH